MLSRFGLVRFAIFPIDNRLGETDISISLSSVWFSGYEQKLWVVRGGCLISNSLKVLCLQIMVCLLGFSYLIPDEIIRQKYIKIINLLFIVWIKFLSTLLNIFTHSRLVFKLFSAPGHLVVLLSIFMLGRLPRTSCCAFIFLITWIIFYDAWERKGFLLTTLARF